MDSLLEKEEHPPMYKDDELQITEQGQNGKPNSHEAESPIKFLPRQRSGVIRRTSSNSRRLLPSYHDQISGLQGKGTELAPSLSLDIDTIKREMVSIPAGRHLLPLGPGVPALGQVEASSLFHSTVQKFPISEHLSTVASTSSPKRTAIGTCDGDPGLQEMKNYIGQVEVLLHQMKDWVAKKEHRSGGAYSDHSGVKLSLSREPKEEFSKVSHRSGIPVPMPPNHLRSGGSSRSRRSKEDKSSRKRKNVFFSKGLKSQWEEAVLEDSQRPISKERIRSGSTGVKNTDGVFNSYIKDCFLQKIKHNMLPSQSGSTLKRSNSFNSASPHAKTGNSIDFTSEGRSAINSLAQASRVVAPVLPQIEATNEVIDYLTPERSARVISAESMLYLEGRLPIVEDEYQTKPLEISQLQLQLMRKDNQGPTKDLQADKPKDSRRSSRADSLVYTVSKNKSFVPRADLSPDGRTRPSDIQDFE